MVLTHRPPPRWLQAIELPRALWMAATWSWRHRASGTPPRGDGRAVMLLPGLFNTDASFWVMRRHLDALGYLVVPWGLGRNLGAKSVGADAERLIARIEEAVRAHGPISLVGVSLGGLLARLAAQRRPDLVREVVTIASPYAGHGRATNVWRAFERFTGERLDDPAVMARAAEIARPLPVPATAIWSRSDGLVQGLICRDPSARCVEVASAHLWVQHQPAVLAAVAAALGDPPSSPKAPGGRDQRTLSARKPG